jgi:hypothetical protein
VGTLEIVALVALAIVLWFKLKVSALTDSARRIEGELLLLKCGMSVLVLDASTNATVPEYRQGLEGIQKDLGEPWVASKKEEELRGAD